ncbi:MAG: response regulator transcription factor [Chloroflexota bacterium]|jgi:DNA-binding NarL/FixJ family response regulator
MKPIRVLLAEDHTLVRAGFQALLRDLPGIQVIAEAGDGREALRLVETQRPDVVLMDITMPGLNGIEATAHMVSDFPEVGVIILSMHADEEYVLRALHVGAAGYLLKDADIAEFQSAITSVAKGETYLSPRISGVVADYVRRAGQEPTSLEMLTPRQREVLQLIAEGHTMAGIGQVLGISQKTVETHRMALMERLDIRDVAGLVRYAIRVGLVAADR